MKQRGGLEKDATLTGGRVVCVAFQLHAAVAAVEQEKFEMQKKHTENIQDLLEDTNGRLAKMEAEYNARSQATVSTQTVVCVCFFLAKVQSVKLFRKSCIKGSPPHNAFCI